MTDTQDILVAVATLMNVHELPQPIGVHLSRPDATHAHIHVHPVDAQPWRGAIDGQLPWRRRERTTGVVFESTGTWRGLVVTVSYIDVPQRPRLRVAEAVA